MPHAYEYTLGYVGCLFDHRGLGPIGARHGTKSEFQIGNGAITAVI